MKDAFKNLSILGHGTTSFECMHGLGYYAHNFLLEALYEYGVLGSILILWFVDIFVVSIKLLKVSLRNSDIYGLFFSLMLLTLFFAKISTSLPDARLLFALFPIVYNELLLLRENV